MTSQEVPLRYRFLIYISLWIIAGTIWAAFSEFSVEAGESQLGGQFAMVYLGPFMAALALAFVLVGRTGGVLDFSNPQGILFYVILGLFLAHGIITLTRKSRMQFKICTIVQGAFLVISIAAVLYFWHWDSLHMHG